jgi:hypothetical protein
MREPQMVEADAATLAKDRPRLAILLLLCPLLMASGAWVGARFSGVAARLNPTVNLAERMLHAPPGPARVGALSPDDLALARARQQPDRLLLEAKAIQHKFDIGSWIFGAWIGAVLGVKLISLALQRRRTDYEPERGDCFACARCFEFCPNELVRRGLQPAATPVREAEPAELIAKAGAK